MAASPARAWGIPMSVMAPVSWGELLDKYTILVIKSERLADPAQAANVRRELEALGPLRARAVAGSPEVARCETDLQNVNTALWEVEDAIRDCERGQDFGPRFVALARSVYRHNDQRAQIKREINQLLGSGLVEEKSYRPY